MFLEICTSKSFSSLVMVVVGPSSPELRKEKGQRLPLWSPGKQSHLGQAGQAGPGTRDRISCARTVLLPHCKLCLFPFKLTYQLQRRLDNTENTYC